MNGLRNAMLLFLVVTIHPGYSSSQSRADEKPAAAETQPADSVDQDYSGELPRIPPQSPDEAKHSFFTAPGYRMEQVAAEPLVTDPIAMSFDEWGRLFVVEMLDYSEDDKANLGRIRMLEDTDGDGMFDKSVIFVDGLSWPTALCCSQGGLFVAAAPQFYYFKDTNGDGKADIRQVVFTGFERSNVQGLVNSLQWGLDNRIHAATSSSGAQVTLGPDHPRSAESAPPALVLRGRDFAFDPQTLTLAATSGGAQHGLTFDDWGRKFVCHNSDHIQLVMFEDRYVARNPYLAPPASRLSIAVDGPQADVFRESPVEPWRLVRTRLRMKGIIPGPVEGGGRAAGYFTSATGITIYRGDLWPEEHRGFAVVGDVGGNLIHRKSLAPAGLALSAHRVDEKSEFVASSDIWFRPVQFANGPDGALYVADMYREVIEHPASLHPVIKKHLDLTSGRDRGRIYRIVPQKSPTSIGPRPVLGNASLTELVATLSHPNGWHRDTAARLLYERQDRRAVPALESLAENSPSPLGRMHALYALVGLQSLSAEILRNRLADADPRVREHAIRCSESLLDDALVRDSLFERVQDDELRVRYQLAFTLGELAERGGRQRTAALAKLIMFNPSDPWMAVAIRSSLASGSGAVLSELARNEMMGKSESGRDWLRTLGTQIGKQQRSEDIAELLEILSAVPPVESTTLQAILSGVAASSDSKLGQQIATATSGRAAALTQELVLDSLAKAQDGGSPLEERIAATQLLRLGKFADVRESLVALLAPHQAPELQAAALATAASYSDLEVAPMVLELWPTFGPRIRSQAGDTLFSRPEWTLAMLQAVAEEVIPLHELDSTRVRLLTTHSNAQIRAQAEKLLSSTPIGRRSEVLDSYRGALTAIGDASQGKEVFKKVCAACHQLAGVGHPTGPNLATMRNRGAENILANVIDPNREVNPQYLNYSVAMQDGRTLSGMIVAETANSITLKRADNATDSILRIDIAEMKNTGLSLMPEGLEKQIDQQAMADLLTYLLAVE